MKLFRKPVKKEKQNKTRAASLETINKSHIRGTEQYNIKKDTAFNRFCKKNAGLGFDVDFFTGSLTQLTALFLAVASVIYFGYHLYSAFSDGVSTAEVHTITEELSVTGDAVYIRDETVLTSTGQGYLTQTLDDGERAAQNEQVAGIYSKDMTLTRRYLKEVENEIEIIARSVGHGVSAGGVLDSFSALKTSYSDLMQKAAGGDWSGYSAMSDDIRGILNRCEYLSGNAKPLEDSLEELKERRAAYSSALANPQYSIKATVPGYYFSRTDGYENLITTELINGFSEDTYRKITAQSPETIESSVGKIVENRKWYLAVEVIGYELQNVVRGDILDVGFFSNGSRSYDMTVVNSIRTDVGFILLLSSDELAINECNTRFQSVKITYDEKSGYRIPVTALHTYEGMTGVFTLHGRNVIFRKINVISEGPGYCIVSPYEDVEKGIEKYYRYISYHYSTIFDENLSFGELAGELSLERVTGPHDGSLGEGAKTVNDILLGRQPSRGTPVRYGTAVTHYYYLDDLENVIVAGRDLYDGKVLG